MRRLPIPLFFAAWSVGAMSVAEARPGLPPDAPIVAADHTVDADTTRPTVGVEEILDRYNDGIRRALAGVESLRVAQTMFEPQDDGSTRRACAVLTYGKERGMVREETFSELTYPAGEYTLASLVGPELRPTEYSVEYAGLDEQQGVPCYRLDVTATVRDYRHFDGSIWISTGRFAPIRIVGEVADPPFPAKEVSLDKVFTEGPHGLWLVRRHTGRGEFRLLFITKRGERRVYYDGYEIEFSAQASRDQNG